MTAYTSLITHTKAFFWLNDVKPTSVEESADSEEMLEGYMAFRARLVQDSLQNSPIEGPCIELETDDPHDLTVGLIFSFEAVKTMLIMAVLDGAPAEEVSPAMLAWVLDEVRARSRKTSAEHEPAPLEEM